MLIVESGRTVGARKWDGEGILRLKQVDSLYLTRWGVGVVFENQENWNGPVKWIMQLRKSTSIGMQRQSPCGCDNTESSRTIAPISAAHGESLDDALHFWISSM